MLNPVGRYGPGFIIAISLYHPGRSVVNSLGLFITDQNSFNTQTQSIRRIMFLPLHPLFIITQNYLAVCPIAGCCSVVHSQAYTILVLHPDNLSTLSVIKHEVGYVGVAVSSINGNCLDDGGFLSVKRTDERERVDAYGHTTNAHLPVNKIKEPFKALATSNFRGSTLFLNSNNTQVTERS